MSTSREECLEALREAAQRLGKSPTAAGDTELGLQPAQGTIRRVVGSWNEAKEAAGLETYDPGSAGGGTVHPVPDEIDMSEEEWRSLSGHQHWYRKNKQASHDPKKQRRKRLKRWVYEYKRDECECSRCGEEHPAALDFHHVDETDKEFSVSRRANRGHSIENIREGIDRCIVLCANRHRREHYEIPPPLDG